MWSDSSRIHRSAAIGVIHAMHNRVPHTFLGGITENRHRIDEHANFNQAPHDKQDDEDRQKKFDLYCSAFATW
jgi:hypothetical protein